MTLKKTEYTLVKEEALDRTMWRARFTRGFGPVLRQTAKRINACHTEKETGHNKPALLDILNGMHKTTS
jgi:hypothetical protein